MLDGAAARALPHTLPDHTPSPGIATPEKGEGWREPAADADAIEGHRVVDSAAEMPRYGDDRWQLDALGRKPGAAPVTIPFLFPNNHERPDEVAQTVRRVAYLLINRGIHPRSLSRPGAQAMRFMGPDSVRMLLGHLRDLLAWGEAQGLERLRDFTPGMIDQYRHEDQPKRPGVWAGGLRPQLTRIADLAPWLPEEDRLPVPSWADGFREPKALSGKAKGSRTEVIPEAMLDPLLAWCRCLIREAGPDIVAARAAVLDRLAQCRDGDDDEIRAWLTGFVEEYGALPRHPAAPKDGEILYPYLAYLSGFAVEALKRNVQWSEKARSRRPHARGWLVSEMPCPVAQPITGSGVDGRPWRDTIDWCDLMPYSTWSFLSAPLIKSVYVAAFVLIGCGTSARPQEIATLPLDCLEEVPPEEDGGIRAHYLHGFTWKNKSLKGEPKEWQAVEIVVDAVKLLQSLGRHQEVDEPWLFPSGGARQGYGDYSGACWTAESAPERFDVAIAYINSDRVQGRLAHPVRIEDPDDPEFRLRPRQLRRSFDIYTQRQPNGEFASMLTLGHAERGLGRSGYSDMSTVGPTYGMTPEQKAEHAEMLAEIDRSLVAGGGVSGPAVDRLLEVLEPFRARYEPKESRVKRLVKEHVEDHGEGRVFNNPRQFAMCLYDGQGKCQGGPEGPDLEGCDPGCDCLVRTDEDARAAEAEAQRFRAEASSPMVPFPRQVRLGQSAARHQAMADAHWAGRRVLPIAQINQGGGR
ncbi:hypothetical protein QQX13_12195 [Demequina sp. SYSU T00068]|uniref:hypothetical protein n=1 Tax=Demequina lignilytica TaxID=3051663 RepID=UPI002613471F|nr:hypothetical protein [Demequina sp. SYSU T00068]MDN4491595.1 hypothetical protein [Demequina sp. SYSU T00068]